MTDQHILAPQSAPGPDKYIRYIGFSVLVLFLFSGMTGLLYEIIWSRMIVKVIGAAPFAISIVLTVFMGGLGLGSFIAGRYIDQIKKPAQLLQLYGLLEIAIGICAFILPGLIEASQPIFSSLYNQTTDHLLLFNLYILIGAVVLFLLPVTLMGATLPILIRFYVAKLGHLGSRVGQLYAINTIGAAVGSLLSGFLLINIWGVSGTLRFAMLMNGMIGGVAFVVANGMIRRSESIENETEYISEGALDQIVTSELPLKIEEDQRETKYSNFQQNAALLIFAISGFAAMAYEVIWTRLLGLIIGPTTYSFTIVLTTFIIGLALGATLFGYLADRSKNPFRLLLLTQIAAALLALTISQILGDSQFLFAKLIYIFKDNFILLSVSKAVLLFLLMLGPTIVLGATFPLVGKIYTRSINHLGKSIGFAYAINTVGALLGSFSAGFILIPLLGKEAGLSLVAGLQILAAVAIYGVVYRQDITSSKKMIPLVVGILGLIMTLIYPRWDRLQLSTGKYYRFSKYEVLLRTTSWWDAFIKAPSDLMPYDGATELVFYGDGIGGFTTVEKDIDAFGKAQYTLYNSGKADASSESDMATQTLAAHIPLLFHPNPKDVMILGLASGVTAGEALYYDLNRLDVLEISEQVIEASKFFSSVNGAVHSHPNSNIIIQDGRAHLELSDQKYDVIISEPSNPWMAGLASLFTEEFFKLAKNQLRWDGIFVQWFPAYQMDWTTYSMVGRTFAKIFPNSLLMKSYISGNDYMLIGFKGHEQLPIKNAWKNLPLLQKSPNLVVEDPRLLYRFMVSDNLQTLFGQGPVHTDDHPILEFLAPQRMHLKEESVERELSERRTLSDDIQDVMRAVLDVEGQLAFTKLVLSVYAPFLEMVDLDEASEEQRERYFQMMLEYSRKTLLGEYDIFNDEELKQAAMEIQISILKDKLQQVPDRLNSYKFLTSAYGFLEDFDQAIHYCRLVIEFDSAPLEGYLTLGYLYRRANRSAEAMAAYEKALSLDPNNSQAYNNLGALYEESNRYDDAREAYEQAIIFDPDLAMPHHNLAGIHEKAKAFDEALVEYQLALQLDSEYSDTYLRMSKLFLKMGKIAPATQTLKALLAIDPEHPEALSSLAVLQMEQGPKAKPQTFVDNTPFKEDETDPRYFYNIAIVAAQKSNYEQAVGHFNRALELRPEYINALIGLGACYQALGNNKAAITQYKKVLVLNPESGGTNNNLAIIYTDRGDFNLAIRYCDQALALGYPVHQEIQDKLKKYR